MTNNFKFVPINYPRPDHVGESVFSRKWAELAPQWQGLWDSDETVFRAALGQYGWNPGQREATVSASFMCWLGTNCGQGYLAEAARLSRTFPHIPGQAYLMAWAVENNRSLGVNFGFRTVEMILTPREDLQKGVRANLRARDLEVIDCLVCWLAGAKGQKFLSECNSEILAASAGAELTS